MDRVSIDKYKGCLIGGAIGDALGAPIEFDDILQIKARFGEKGLTDYVELPGNTGAFTDDTQMTLFTAEGLLRAQHRASLKGIGGALIKITYKSYLRWLHTQDHSYPDHPDTNHWAELGEGWLIKEKTLYKRRAPGNTCLTALRSGISGTIQNPVNESKGCGTIMRMAPVGLMLYGRNELAFDTACELSAITHGHPTGYLSAGFFASVIADLSVGIDLERGIWNAAEILKSHKHHEETLKAVHKAMILYKGIRTRGNPIPMDDSIAQLGEGWIAEEALSISIFASLTHMNDFRSGVLYAVNHSGDSDSTGSITGNILGLINGIGTIPGQWIRNLEHADLVRQVAEDVYIEVKGDLYNPHDEWWEKYPGY